MKLKETEYIKFQYVNNIQTILSNMNIIQISGSELVEIFSSGEFFCFCSS